MPLMQPRPEIRDQHTVRSAYCKISILLNAWAQSNRDGLHPFRTSRRFASRRDNDVAATRLRRDALAERRHVRTWSETLQAGGRKFCKGHEARKRVIFVPFGLGGLVETGYLDTKEIRKSDKIESVWGRRMKGSAMTGGR